MHAFKLLCVYAGVSAEDIVTSWEQSSSAAAGALFRPDVFELSTSKSKFCVIANFSVDPGVCRQYSCVCLYVCMGVGSILTISLSSPTLKSILRSSYSKLIFPAANGQLCMLPWPPLESASIYLHWYRDCT